MELSLSNLQPSTPAEIHQLFDVKELLADYPVKEYKKGSFIYTPNSNTDKIYYLEEGRLLIGDYDGQGREVITSFLFKGQIFGEQGLIGIRKRVEYAKAKDRCVVREIHLPDLRKQMLRNGALGIHISQLILQKLSKSKKRWKSQIANNAKKRVIDFILDLIEAEGRQVGFEWVVDQFFTQLEISKIIGTSRQTVTVTLTELRNMNLIYFDRKRLLVRDMDKLNQIELSF